MLRHAPLQTFEYFSRAGCAAQFVCFVTDGKCCFRLCLLCTDAETIALVGCNFEIFPLQFQNVADAQTSQASEKRGRFEYGYVAWSGCKLFDFIQCKIFLFYVLQFNLIQEVVDVLAKPFITVGNFQQSTESRVITGSRIERNGTVGMFELLGVQ